jgi:hypothetical protein
MEEVGYLQKFDDWFTREPRSSETSQHASIEKLA